MKHIPTLLAGIAIEASLSVSLPVYHCHIMSMIYFQTMARKAQNPTFSYEMVLRENPH